MYNHQPLLRKGFKKPECPFCGMIIEKPKELSFRKYGEMPIGICSCGAVYVCDETGHNLGSAMIEALIFACNMDWDLAWNLSSDEDYKETIIKNYDYNRHLIVPGGYFEGRRISSALYFLKLEEDIREVTAEGVFKRFSQKTLSSNKQTIANKKKLSKKEVEDLVNDYNFNPIINVANEDKRIIPKLQRLLYSGDNQFRMRAAEAIGYVCGIIADTNPKIVSRLLQNLFYAITDTAAFPWGAFEAIGEIISKKPEQFAGYIPLLYQFLPDETRRPQALQAIEKIARAKPELLRKTTFYFFHFLKDSNPLVRGYTAKILGDLGAYEARKELEQVIEDTGEIEVYEDGNLVKKSVGEIVSEALSKI